MIGPTTPYSSVENGKFAYVGYTGVYNVLDYPAVSFPCGVHSDKSIDAAYVNHSPLSEVDARVQQECKFCPWELFLYVLETNDNRLGRGCPRHVGQPAAGGPPTRGGKGPHDDRGGVAVSGGEDRVEAVDGGSVRGGLYIEYLASGCRIPWHEFYHWLYSHHLLSTLPTDLIGWMTVKSASAER